MAFGSNIASKLGPKTGKGKQLRPGNHKCKINSVSTSTANWKGVDKLFLHLHMEGEAIEGFEGFYKDKDNTSLGRYDGQIANVKTSGFGYDDNRKGKDGVTITKEESVAMFLDSLCYEVNGSTWIKDAISKGTYKTFEDFINAFNKANPIKDEFITYCIGGTQDTDENGYPKYWLNIPRFEKGFRLYANDDNLASLLPYNAAEHLYVKGEAKPVQKFAPAVATEEPAIEFNNVDDDMTFNVETEETPFDMGDEGSEDDSEFDVQS